MDHYKATNIYTRGRTMNAEDQEQLNEALRKAVADERLLRDIQSLLDKGAEINAKDKRGKTPLHYACEKGNPKAVRMLIDAGADIHVVNNNKNTPLHLACGKGSPETVRMMIDAGADIHAVNIDGNTPLLYACTFITVNVGVVRALLEAGADIHAVNDAQQTILDLIPYLLHGSPELRSLMKEKGVDLRQYIQRIPIKRVEERIKQEEIYIAEVKESAESGDANAQCVLARLYDNGYDMWQTCEQVVDREKYRVGGIFRELEEYRELEECWEWAEYRKWGEFWETVDELSPSDRIFIDPYDPEVVKRLKVEKRKAILEAISKERKAAGASDDEVRLVLVKQDHEQAVKWYRAAAEQRHAEARYFLGECYYNGRGVAQDYEQAAKWYWGADLQGHAEIQYFLGECYYSGQGVAQNYKQAVKWYRAAAKQGHAGAQCCLGECYINGLGVKKDPAKAVELFKKSAVAGEPVAMNNLAACYGKGEGVGRNPERAVYLYRKAAEQGLPVAMKNLGLCYLAGDGIPKNEEEAEKWLSRAASLGLPSAVCESPRHLLHQR